MIGGYVLSIGVSVPMKKLKYEEELKHGDCEVRMNFACGAFHIYIRCDIKGDYVGVTMW